MKTISPWLCSCYFQRTDIVPVMSPILDGPVTIKNDPPINAHEEYDTTFQNQPASILHL